MRRVLIKQKAQKAVLLFALFVLTLFAFSFEWLPILNSIQPSFTQNQFLAHGDMDVHYVQASVPEFWSDHPLDIYEAFAQHSFKTLDTCNNVCPRGAPVCTAKTNQEFRDLIQEDLIQQKPFLDRGQYVYSWEKKYLSYPPLIDTKTLPSLTLSRVTVKNVTQGVVTCHMFETIQGRLDVVNGYGRQRTKGDDVVRVWMKGDNSTTGDNSTDYASVGDVIDLHNGSYLFSVKCLWPGFSSLNVAVSYPREFIRIVIHQIHVGASMYMTGRFAKGSVKEETICFNTPNIPGWECICNFSTLGYDSFYCGRPRDSRLSCDDWVDGDRLQNPPPHDVTAAELDFLKTIRGKPSQKIVRHHIMIFTENNEFVSGNVPDLPPCRKSNKNVTWVNVNPKGFWAPGNIWTSLVCKTEDVITSRWTLNCLRDTNVWIFGDSNARLAYFTLNYLTQCTKSEGGWPLKGRCYVPEYNITINLIPHEPPRYSLFRRSDNFTGVPDFIQTLPANEKHVLIIHYYLHFTPAHLSVLSLRMRKLRTALEKLLAKNPNILVGLRGPHVVSLYYSNHAVGGDPLGPQFLELIRKRFRGLEDKVVFLDMWEMSIGIENLDYHPPQFLSREMIKFFLSFQC